ncbi:hypothetical protein J3R82DRAFT_6457 [Butyriboletus roseoflavus]|nr:hypothetical protein J3R82DRAFT_6457 [Butyriboletus roseoflavus]
MVLTSCNSRLHSLHVTYRRLIPAIEVSSHLFVARQPCSPISQIEILPAGEHGPRRLDTSTTMNIKGIPFLSLSEFVRDKLKAWSMQVSSHMCPLTWLTDTQSRLGPRRK